MPVILAIAHLSNHSEDSVNSMEEKTEKVSGNGVRRAPPPSLDGGARPVMNISFGDIS